MVGESDEVEIDIDKLDNQTLRELEKYVNDCLNPKPQAPSKAVASRKAVRPNGAAKSTAKQGGLTSTHAGASVVGTPGGLAAESSDDSDDSSDDSDRAGDLAGTSRAFSPNSHSDMFN